jgi:membrane protein YqaA with SNARE-associated domain
VTGLESWAVAHGGWGLFVVAFLAATILPFSSEVAFAGALAAKVPVGEALVFASVGNCLACLLNYGLGALFHERAGRKLQASRVGRKALDWSQRYGPIALLASWLPIVGDPLTIAAGVTRVRFGWFAAVVIPLRVLRYVAIAWPFLA